MCLNTVDAETKEYTEGYKIFYKIDGKLHSVYFAMKEEMPFYKEEEWIKDTKEEKIEYMATCYYPTGFHFFVNKEDAIKRLKVLYKINGLAVIRKVKVRNIVATGKEIVVFNPLVISNVGVCKEMYIKEGGKV